MHAWLQKQTASPAPSNPFQEFVKYAGDNEQPGSKQVTKMEIFFFFVKACHACACEMH